MQTGSGVNQGQEPISDRMGMRLSPELKRKIQTAAQLKGLPVAGFMKAVLDEAASQTIKEHEFIELTLRDREAFVKALFSSMQPSKKSIAAGKRYKERLGL